MLRDTSDPDKEDPEESQEANQQKGLALAHVYRKDPQPEDGRRQRALMAGEVKSPSRGRPKQRTPRGETSPEQDQRPASGSSHQKPGPPPVVQEKIPARPSTTKEASALNGESAGVGYALRTGIQ